MKTVYVVHGNPDYGVLSFHGVYETYEEANDIAWAVKGGEVYETVLNKKDDYTTSVYQPVRNILSFNYDSSHLLQDSLASI